MPSTSSPTSASDESVSGTLKRPRPVALSLVDYTSLHSIYRGTVTSKFTDSFMERISVATQQESGHFDNALTNHELHRKDRESKISKFFAKSTKGGTRDRFFRNDCINLNHEINDWVSVSRVYDVLYCHFTRDVNYELFF